MPSSLGQLEALTYGERLLLDRRRRGESQAAAAQRLGASYHIYSGAELDRWEIEGVQAPALGKLDAHERCVLYRRRAECTQAEVAKELGVCRWWLNQMERGLQPCQALLDYWEC
jgi:DNA-binding XRE family transcriptional regulator